MGIFINMKKATTKSRKVSVKTKPKKERAKKYDEKVSLAPLTFDEAMGLAVKTRVK